MARCSAFYAAAIVSISFMLFANIVVVECIGIGIGIGNGNGKGSGRGNGKGHSKGNGDSFSVGFYSKSCPNAELIIKGVVTKHFQTDKSIPAALLRMHFHDCFVTGCDASLLLDSTPSNTAEKEALPNLTVRGYEIINEAKQLLEKVCPLNVSCADIISLATRDSVALAGGPSYELPTGRRDGRVSLASQVDLPSPRISIRDATAQFESKGLTRQDMVVLLGAHTVGISHCLFFSDRLYDFEGTGEPDPSMNTTLVEELKKVCPPPPTSPPTVESIHADGRAFLDQGTPFPIDNSFYNQVKMAKGVLQIDRALGDDRATQPIVESLASDGDLFSSSFGEAMVRMGSIGVQTGIDGEIRRTCSRVN